MDAEQIESMSLEELDTKIRGMSDDLDKLQRHLERLKTAETNKKIRVVYAYTTSYGGGCFYVKSLDEIKLRYERGATTVYEIFAVPYGNEEIRKKFQALAAEHNA